MSFENNPFIHFISKPKEVSVLIEEFNKKLNIKTKYYELVLNIVQEVKTYTQPVMLKGKLFYSPCTNKSCLHFEEKKIK